MKTIFVMLLGMTLGSVSSLAGESLAFDFAPHSETRCVAACGAAYPKGSISYNGCVSGCFGGGGHSHHDPRRCVQACGMAYPKGSIAYNGCVSGCF